MKHLILGAGNLGLDLEKEITKKEKALVLSKSTGINFTNYLDLLNKIKELNPEVLWVSVGGGSVPDCKIGHPNHPHSVYLNTILPVSLNRDLPEKIKIVFFSTDYVANEIEVDNPKRICKKPLSEYAKQKMDMENQIMVENKPNRAIVRVASLYGIHKPQKTFPGKMLLNFALKNDKINLPINRVCPTATRWLAFCLFQNLKNLFSRETNRHHCAAQGHVSVKDWGKIILKGYRCDADFVQSYPSFVDDERPPLSDLGCSFATSPHWADLWSIYFKPELYLPRYPGL